MPMLAILDGVEWNDDFVNWIFGILVAAACVSAGFTIGRRWPFMLLAGLAITAFATLDYLHWHHGLNPGSIYCEWTGCDQIPLSFSSFAFVGGLLLALLGVSLRRRRDPRRAPHPA